MKVTNIVTMMGSGVVLGLTGGILIVSSAALGLHAAFESLPQWAAFLIVGVATAAAGGFLLSRSGTETSKKIEKVERKFTLHEAWKRKPWVMLGASVAVGFVAQRLLRWVLAPDGKAPEIHIEPEGLYERRAVREEKERESKHSALKDFFMKPLSDLARHATSRAIALGTQMVVTPILMKKLQEFMDQHNMNFAQQDNEPQPGADGQPRDDYSQPHQGNGSRRF